MVLRLIEADCDTFFVKWLKLLPFGALKGKGGIGIDPDEPRRFTDKARNERVKQLPRDALRFTFILNSWI